MLWICLGCTSRYSVDAPRCPECGSTEYVEEGQDMPKITVHGGASYAPADSGEGDQGFLEDAPVAKPAVNEPKAAWVAYAVSLGWTTATAEAATKADLVTALKG